MNPNKIVISSLSMDLKRVALSYHNGSNKTAKRFVLEALKRNDEIDLSMVSPYIYKILKLLPDILNYKNKQNVAENALMYSTIFQNYIINN